MGWIFMIRIAENKPIKKRNGTGEKKMMKKNVPFFSTAFTDII